MRRLSPLLLAVGLFAPVCNLLAEEPQAFLNACVRKSICDDDAMRTAAVHVRLRGTVTLPTTTEDVPCILDVFHKPDGETKTVLSLSLDGTKYTIKAVTCGKRDWCSLADDILDLTPSQYIGLKRLLGRLAPVALLPLARSNGKEPAIQDRTLVDERPVLNVRLKLPGQDTLDLFFDKEKRFLHQAVVTEMRGQPPLGQEVIFTFSAYGLVDPVKEDEALVKSAGLRPDDVRLLDVYTKKSLDDATKRQVADQIRHLGDVSFEKREQAVKELVGHGRAALELLEKATTDPDLEIARRAKHCIAVLEKQSEPEVRAAALRTFARRHRDEAVKQLLGLLPDAEEQMVAEVQAVLVGLALRDGKPDPLLVQALDDKQPVRRAVASAILGKDRGASLVAVIQPLTMHDLKYPRKVDFKESGSSGSFDVIDVEFFKEFDAKLFDKP